MTMEGVRVCKHVSMPWLVLALTVLADWLFFCRVLGWTLGAYGVVVALTLLARARPRFRPAMVRIGIPLLVVLFALIVRTDWLTAVAAGGLLLTLAVTAGGGAPRLVVEWPLAWGRFVRRVWKYMTRRLARVGTHRRSGAHPVLSGLARNWLLPIGLSLVFVILFSVANPIFSSWVAHGVKWVEALLEAWMDPVRWLFWSVAAFTAWSLLRYRAPRIRPELHWTSPASGLRPFFPLGRTLVLFNAVFAFQNLLDFRYLLYGATLPAGMTYAQYAHRGAYPLVVTALLAGGFILWAFPPGRDGDNRACVLGLLYVWIVQNVILAMAAAWRLWLYVGGYGLTRLRLASAIWIAIVAMGLLLAGLRLACRFSTDWLVRANLAVLFLALTVWALTDVNGRIARFNVAHCRELSGAGVGVDVAYLQSLGPAALPALDVLVMADGVPTRVGLDVLVARGQLEVELAGYVEDWRGWTVQRYRLSRTRASLNTQSR